MCANTEISAAVHAPNAVCEKNQPKSCLTSPVPPSQKHRCSVQPCGKHAGGPKHIHTALRLGPRHWLLGALGFPSWKWSNTRGKLLPVAFGLLHSSIINESNQLESSSWEQLGSSSGHYKKHRPGTRKGWMCKNSSLPPSLFLRLSLFWNLIQFKRQIKHKNQEVKQMIWELKTSHWTRIRTTWSTFWQCSLLLLPS